MAESTIQRPGVAAVVRALLPQRGARWTSEAIALTTVVGALTVIGLVMSFSASFVDAAETGDPFGVFLRQLLWAGVGVPVFLIAANLDHGVWRRLSWLLMAGALGGLVAVLTGLGITEGGSTRWLALGPLVVQPSEITKLATVLWLADVFTRKRAQGIDPSTDPRHAFLPAVPLLVVLSVLVMAQPDLGTTLLLGLIVGLVLLVEGAPLRHMGTLFVAGGTFALVAAVAAPYRFARIAGWLDPEADPLGNGYQLLQSMYALGSGGWFGLGLGSSRGKWNFVPNPETDFIFAIIGEELGVVGAVLVLTLFAAIVVLGLRVARTARDPFGRTVAFVVTGWITGQALVNVAAVTGLLPITGVTLPLVSVGGSSLVSTLLALGILVAIARARARPHRKVPR
ncbi:MAG: putative lipid II flippase FtsW [Actinobacteria bacterium]|nr:putative lipid II flippase FtsW [Actinomycetota bacterium]